LGRRGFQFGIWLAACVVVVTASFTSPVFAGLGENWKFVNPLPTGNELTGVATGDSGLLVAVGDSSILTSLDGVNPETFLSGPGSDPNNGNRGIALTKNFIKGTFHTSMFNVYSGGNRLLALSGVIVAEKDGDAKKISGKIAGRDWGNRCIYTGKFKGKQCPDNKCLIAP
jgi:hypothetical protein